MRIQHYGRDPFHPVGRHPRRPLSYPFLYMNEVFADYTTQTPVAVIHIGGGVTAFTPWNGKSLRIDALAVLPAGVVLQGGACVVCPLPVPDLSVVAVIDRAPGAPVQSLGSGVVGNELFNVSDRFRVYERRLYPGEVAEFEGAACQRTIVVCAGCGVVGSYVSEDPSMDFVASTLSVDPVVPIPDLFNREGMEPGQALYAVLNSRSDMLDDLPHPGDPRSEFNYLQPFTTGTVMSFGPEEGMHMASLPDDGRDLRVIVIEA